jgi:hypothetical protein
MTITTDFDTTDPSRSSFLISNDGYLPVYSVRVHCLLGMLDMGNPPKLSSALPGEKGELMAAFDTGALPVTTLFPGAKETVPWTICSPFRFAPGAALQEARLGLRVLYRPLLSPRNRTISQEFYARGIGNGQYIWYSVPYLK